MSDDGKAPGRRTMSGRGLRDGRTWSIVGCVALAFALAMPTIADCSGGLSSCRWTFNHLGTTGDQRYFAALWEATRATISDFHQLPSWNPYHCGGIVLYQDPQAPFPGPLFLLTFFWLPTAVGIKVWVLAHLLCGTLGARALIADRGGNAAEQVLGATLIAACGFFAEHTGGGHLSFTPLWFLPLMLWAFRRSLRDLRYVVLAAALLAIADVEGGTYPVPLMAVAVLVETTARLGSSADRRGLALAVPTFAVLFLLLASVRMVPVLHYLREHPRLVPLDDQLTLGEVFRFWTTRTHARSVDGHKYVWPEYDTYVGVIPVVLMLIGAAVAVFGDEKHRRERRIDFLLMAALVWCALGNIPGASAFGLLHELPIYASLRVPSRFLGPAMVGFGLLAAGALAAARRVGAPRSWRAGIAHLALALEIALVVGISLDVCLTNQRVMQQGTDPILSRARASADFFQNDGVSYAAFPTFPVQGFGTRNCYVPLEWKPSVGIVEGRRSQAWLRPVEHDVDSAPSPGTVKQVRWTPNQIELEVRADRDAVVVVNQNYDTGWQSNLGVVGAYVAPDHRFWDVRATPDDLPDRGAIGLLAVRVRAGAHVVVLRHRPAGLGVGFLISLLGTLLAVVVVRRATPARVARMRARFLRAITKTDDISPRAP